MQMSTWGIITNRPPYNNHLALTENVQSATKPNATRSNIFHFRITNGTEHKTNGKPLLHFLQGSRSDYPDYIKFSRVFLVTLCCGAVSLSGKSLDSSVSLSFDTFWSQQKLKNLLSYLHIIPCTRRRWLGHTLSRATSPWRHTAKPFLQMNISTFVLCLRFIGEAVTNRNSRNSIFINIEDLSEAWAVLGFGNQFYTLAWQQPGVWAGTFHFAD